MSWLRPTWRDQGGDPASRYSKGPDARGAARPASPKPRAKLPLTCRRSAARGTRRGQPRRHLALTGVPSAGSGRPGHASSPIANEIINEFMRICQGSHNFYTVLLKPLINVSANTVNHAEFHAPLRPQRLAERPPRFGSRREDRGPAVIRLTGEPDPGRSAPPARHQRQDRPRCGPKPETLRCWTIRRYWVVPQRHA